MVVHDLFEDFAKKMVVVLPGRFQPWHKGHAAVYKHLVQQYGADNVFIATSDKTDNAKSPFSFDEKRKMMILTGVDSSKIVFSTQPYRAVEVTKNFDPTSTTLLFAISEKDMAEDPRFQFGPKKDGSPSYFQPFKDPRHCEPLDKHAYMITVPTFNFTVLGQPANSASQIRAQFGNADEETKKKIVTDLFGKFDPVVYNIMNNKLQATAPVTESLLEKPDMNMHVKPAPVEPTVADDTQNPDPKISSLAKAVLSMKDELSSLNQQTESVTESGKKGMSKHAKEVAAKSKKYYDDEAVKREKSGETFNVGNAKVTKLPVKEEQVNELSSDTLRKYQVKARVAPVTNLKQANNRIRGVRAAGEKEHMADVIRTAKSKGDPRMSESTPRKPGALNELSKSTLKSYSKTAGEVVHADQRDAKGARDMANDNAKYGKDKQAAEWNDEGDWLDKRAEKRAGNIAKATTKIAKKPVGEALGGVPWGKQQDMNEGPPASTPKFPDTKQGAVASFTAGANKRFVQEMDLPNCKVHPDPQVEGVWAIDNYSTGVRVIVYLAGYKTPGGGIRGPFDDFEEGQIPAKVMKRNKRNDQAMNDAEDHMDEGRMVKGVGGVPLDRQGNPIPPKVVAPKAPAAPRVHRDANGLSKDDYRTVWRKIEEVVGQIFPDGDPIDYLAPWLRKGGVESHHIGDIMNKACKLNGYKDIYAYYDSFKSADYGWGPNGMEESVTEGSGEQGSYEHAFEFFRFNCNPSQLRDEDSVVEQYCQENGVASQGDISNVYDALYAAKDDMGPEGIEEEQVNELSPETLKRYIPAANRSREAVTRQMGKVGGYNAKLDDKMGRRAVHTLNAINKTYKPEPVEEAGIGATIKKGIKSVKRGLLGWDKNAIGPGGEELGNPKDIVRRNKGHGDDTVQRLAQEKDLGFPFGKDSKQSPHSPRGLQKRVLNREIKKRGLDNNAEHPNSITRAPTSQFARRDESKSLKSLLSNLSKHAADGNVKAVTECVRSLKPYAAKASLKEGITANVAKALRVVKRNAK